MNESLKNRVQIDRGKKEIWPKFFKRYDGSE